MDSRLWWLLLCQLALLVTCCCSDDDITGDCKLSPILVPLHYTLKFKFNFTDRSFKGESHMTGYVQEPTKLVYLDSGVTVKETRVEILEKRSSYSDKDLKVVEVIQNTSDSLLIVHFNKPLVEKVFYQLKFKFHGDIRPNLGIFGGNYTDPDGAESFYVGSEFQPQYASSAFPCIDRPAYKASFDIHLFRDQRLVALSNMPLASTSEPGDDGQVEDSFYRTPPMSTYLVSIVVADLARLPCGDGKTTLWALRGREHRLNSACELAPMFLKVVEKMTGIPYQLPKLDHVGLPGLIAMGMENWGLIIYKEEEILAEKEDYVLNTMQLNFVLAHETVHQWFGNLVTCESWADIWLNEGVTSFLHFLVTHKIHPEWDAMGLLLSQYISRILKDDYNQPVALARDSCQYINDKYVFIMYYYKGAALMRMLYMMIQEDHLLDGLHAYLEKNMYSTAVDTDLWVEFEHVAEELGIGPEEGTFFEAMTSWTKNRGLPLLRVIREQDKVILQQEPFNQDKTDERNDTSLWYIPLTYTTSDDIDFSDVTPKQWMSNQTMTLDIVLPNNSWIIFNLQQMGFYRVLYDEHQWELISQELRYGQMERIHPYNRAQLLNDAFLFAAMDMFSFHVPLQLSTYLVRETHYMPWSEAIPDLAYVQYSLRNSINGKLFEKYLYGLIEEVFDELTDPAMYEDPVLEPMRRLLNREMLSLGCRLGHPSCEHRAKYIMSQIFDKNFKKTRLISDTSVPLMCKMVEFGNIDMWYYAFNMYKNESSQEMKSFLLESLSCTTNITHFKRFISNVLEDENYLTQPDDLWEIVHSVDDVIRWNTIIDVIDEFASANGTRINKVLTKEIVYYLGATHSKKKLEKLILKHKEVIDNPEQLLKYLNKKRKWKYEDDISSWLSQIEETNMLARSLTSDYTSYDMDMEMTDLSQFDRVDDHSSHRSLNSTSKATNHPSLLLSTALLVLTFIY